MNMLLFARRNGREILRDPLNLAFGLAFPLALLGLFCAIQANIPVPIFALPSLTPGILVFGFSFFSLFSALLVARDRTSAFLLRLYTTPLRSRDFILGYLLPLLPLAMGQGAVCLGGALIFGLDWSPRLLLTLAAGIPAALLYIGLGLLCGSCLNDRAVGGICGALLTNVSLFLSGAWLDLDLVGSGFARFARLLPFSHAVEAGRAALAGDLSQLPVHLAWVSGWAVAHPGPGGCRLLPVHAPGIKRMFRCKSLCFATERMSRFSFFGVWQIGKTHRRAHCAPLRDHGL